MTRGIAMVQGDIGMWDGEPALMPVPSFSGGKENMRDGGHLPAWHHS